MPVLAPVYDVVCTDVYPLAKRMAMKIDERALPDTIRLEDWQKMVPDTQVAKWILSNDLLRMANAIEIEAERLLDEMTGQNLYHPVLKKIRRTIGVRVRTIQSLWKKLPENRLIEVWDSNRSESRVCRKESGLFWF